MKKPPMKIITKMYSYIENNNKEIIDKIMKELINLSLEKSENKTAKGITENIKKKELRHENYKDVLLNTKQLRHTMKVIRRLVMPLSGSSHFSLVGPNVC